MMHIFYEMFLLHVFCHVKYIPYTWYINFITLPPHFKPFPLNLEKNEPPGALIHIWSLLISLKFMSRPSDRQKMYLSYNVLITEYHFCNQAIIKQQIRIDPPVIVSQSF